MECERSTFFTENMSGKRFQPGFVRKSEHHMKDSVCSGNSHHRHPSSANTNQHVPTGPVSPARNYTHNTPFFTPPLQYEAQITQVRHSDSSTRYIQHIPRRNERARWTGSSDTASNRWKTRHGCRSGRAASTVYPPLFPACRLRPSHLEPRDRTDLETQGDTYCCCCLRRRLRHCHAV